MSTFHGLCSYPHGGNSSFILWFSLACATICTCYSISSCRLVVLSYTSNLGDFEDHFVTFDAAIESQRYQVGMGLFTWLRPNFYVDGDDDTVTRAEVGNWREGSCAGYTTLQLDDILDPTLESVRILGVLSVLISFSVFLFSLLLSCLSLASWQRYILAVSCLVVGVVNGCVLLVLNSDVCTAMGTDPDEPPTCAMDQGGLVAIAAVILWICSALLVFFFIEPVRDPGMHDKMVATRQDKKRQSGLKKMRKENKVDWNASNKSKQKGKNNKQQRRRTKSESALKSSKRNKPKKEVHSSFSLPKYTVEEAFDTSSDAAQKPKRNSRSAPPPAVAAAAPIMLNTSNSKQRTRPATNKSLEARYVPQTTPVQYHREEKKSPDDPESSSSSYDCVPLSSKQGSVTKKQNPASGAYYGNHLTEQDEIIRGVSQKLHQGSKDHQHQNNYYFQPTTTTTTRPTSPYEQEHPDPPGLNRADSRSMLSSLTSPSFKEMPGYRQKALAEALEDDLAVKNHGPLHCCGVGLGV